MQSSMVETDQQGDQIWSKCTIQYEGMHCQTLWRYINAPYGILGGIIKFYF